jgi:hypothetical protein
MERFDQVTTKTHNPGVDYSPFMVESDEEAMVMEERRPKAMVMEERRQTAFSRFLCFSFPPPFIVE